MRPPGSRMPSLILLGVMVAQGIIGYTQYFTHLPAVLVGVHVFGASMVWATALWFHHGLSDHAVEEELAPMPDRPSLAAAAGTAAVGAVITPAADRTDVAVREPA